MEGIAGCGNCLFENTYPAAGFTCPFHNDASAWETNVLPQVTCLDMAQYIIDTIHRLAPDAHCHTPREVVDRTTLPHGEVTPLVEMYMQCFRLNVLQVHPE